MKSSKLVGLLFITFLILSSLMIVGSAFAQSISEPSVPDFMAKVVANTIEVTIKNHPLTPYENGSYPSLYYMFRFKDHNTEEGFWDYDPVYFVLPSTYGGYHEASDSEFTVISISLEGHHFPSGLIDIQAIALVGNQYLTNMQNGTVYGFDGEISGWSNTQTLTVGENLPYSIWVAISLVVIVAVLVVTLVYWQRLHKQNPRDRRTVKLSKVLVIFLIFSIFFVSFTQIEVNAQSNTIYIRADGTVEGTDRLQRVGNLYSFTSDINESIIVERENIVIDGAGYLLEGNNTEYGIKLESSGVTIKNMQISRFEYGIYVYLSSNNNVIINNRISGTSRGIYVRGTDNNTITGNKLTNNGEGIYLSATNSALRNNEMENNSYNFGIIPQPRYNDIDTSNIVNGKPICYWTNQHDKTVPLDAGCVILINCTNIKVKNLTLTNNKEGITVINTKNSEIKNCVLSNHKSGIRTSICSNVNITQNIFKKNGEGLTIWESTGILVNENQIINNTETGIELFDSKEHNIVKDNYISGSSIGIEFTASSNNNTLNGNTITNCNQAILFTTSTFNTLRNNAMFDNKKDFHLEHGHYTDVSREIPYFINDVDSSNTIDDKPMYYWINKQNKTVPSDAGYVVLMNCTNITVSNLQQVETILVAYTNDSLISQNLIENSDVGVKIWRCSNNDIVANQLFYNEVGLSIHFSENNDAYWNNISNNLQGVSLSGDSNNNIFRNVISNNHNGIYLDWANNNTIYNNNFVNNTRHVYDTTETVFPWLAPTSSHNWNQTYPVGGNYWSNFTGVDLKSGENQNLTGSDGIIDMPFDLYSNNTDNYPLAEPIIFFDAGIWEWEQYYVSCITNSSVSDFYFNPLEGAFIRFNATEENSTIGFCRVIVSKRLLNSQNGWNVLINGEPVTPIISEDTNNNYLYFTYSHSIKTIEIIGTDAIPEFLSWIILPLLMLASLLVIIFKKKVFRSIQD